MKVTLNFLEKIEACDSAIEAWRDYDFDSLDIFECIKLLRSKQKKIRNKYEANSLLWATWLLPHCMENNESIINYANFCKDLAAESAECAAARAATSAGWAARWATRAASAASAARSAASAASAKWAAECAATSAESAECAATSAEWAASAATSAGWAARWATSAGWAASAECAECAAECATRAAECAATAKCAAARKGDKTSLQIIDYGIELLKESLSQVDNK